jgi:hypothetical protein
VYGKCRGSVAEVYGKCRGSVAEVYRKRTGSVAEVQKCTGSVAEVQKCTGSVGWSIDVALCVRICNWIWRVFYCKLFIINTTPYTAWFEHKMMLILAYYTIYIP